MRNPSEHFQAPRPTSQERKKGLKKLDTLHSPGFGYLAAVIFVIGLLGIEKLDEIVPQAPLFVGAPFGLVAILVALIWGIGPALLALALGLIIIAEVISPGIFTPDFLRDGAILGPFIILEIIAIGVVVHLEKTRRTLFRAKQELEQEHEKVLQSHQQLEQANAEGLYVDASRARAENSPDHYSRSHATLAHAYRKIRRNTGELGNGKKISRRDRSTRPAPARPDREPL